MDGRKLIDRLDLQHDLVSHHEVHALLAQQFLPISDLVPLFALETDASGSQFETDGARVDPFQQSRSQFSMHCDAATDRVVYQLFDLVRQEAWSLQH